MEVFGLCHASGSNSRAMVFGFRMRCMVANPRLVPFPDSRFSDSFFPLHQSDPFNNNVLNVGANP